MSQPVSPRVMETVPPDRVVSAAEAGATEVTMVSVTAATTAPSTFFAVRGFIMVSSAMGVSAAFDGHDHCGHPRTLKTTERRRE
jgi:hypothetical protein